MAGVPSDFQSTNNPSLSPSSSSNGHTLTISPGMTQYWIPHCEDEIKPAVDMIFKTLDAGLVPSLQHRDGTKTQKQIVCNREGFKNTGAQHCHSQSSADAGEGPSRPKRRRVSNRTGCRARIIFKYIGVAGYQVTTFIEKHNHGMSSVLASYIVGDYSKVGATVVDFKNVRRDLRAYILGADAQILAMGIEPRIIVTDQDPAMKVAIPTVGPTLNKDEEFRNKLSSIVWTSSLEPPDFEKQWRELMEKYNLVEHNWFTTMFEARKHWIPTYFRDGFMGGLLRTTSRSESENYTYNHFTGPQSSLVEFMMNSDSALKSQRNTNAKLNSDNEGYNPDMKTPLGIEKHASIVYTITVFYQVQEEICASCFKCMVLSVREYGGMLHYDIMDGKNKRFTVVQNVNDHEAKCSCKMFEMKQLLMSRKEKLSPQHSRKTVIESFCGSIAISEINILPPKHAKNKGNGKRIKSSKELAMEKEKGRRCNFCGVRGDQHDTRTCPLNPKNKDKQKGKKKMMSLKLRMTNDASGLECVVFVVSYNHYKLEGEEDENDREDEE
ncbi:PREDICTED: protein FAR1-RELATED SEQUENCE 1-like [Ipomoea nil]|uniref:protein FAR1-RELATED SEQUENCE 1-like n=1 Tax=Ipomoea nil TaxID=35883 RepID=UPI000901E9BC|nr:PREDICTED: protein FAR1-RELATED SEQUENCE 1-like [Ipomoea nil]